MKLRTLFIGDTRSLYFAVRQKFGPYALNYLDLLQKLEKDHNLSFIFKVLYGKYEQNTAHRFQTMLRETGFEFYFDRKYYDAEMALKAARIIPNVDSIVVASTWYGHYSILEYAKELGKYTYLVGVNIPKFAKHYATGIEIDESILKRKEPQDENFEPTNGIENSIDETP
jgi:hypothetical protein